MTDLEKKILDISQTHPDYNELLALNELKTLNEIDSDLISNLWTLKKRSEELKYSGTANDRNLYLAYYLGITSKKPDGEFNLPNRRTYARSGFPDIDMDFDYERRHEIVEYLINKYGRENVGNIGTLQTLKTKAAVRKTIKVLDPTNSIRYDKEGKPIKSKTNENFALENEILKTLPNIMKRGDGTLVKSIEEACDEYPAFEQHMKAYPEVFRIAKTLEDSISGTGIHAGGICLSPIPLCRIAPLHVTTDKGQLSEEGTAAKVLATQFPMADIERLGLIKFDILGISTITAISIACKLIKEEHGVNIDWNTLLLDDKKSLDLLKSGLVEGCFQLEQKQMKDCLKTIGMDSFNDLVVAIAMYRPGPKDFIPDFASKKHGKTTISYPHEKLRKITSSTYSIICYQEDTLISLANGSEKPIKEIQVGDLVHSLNPSTNKIEARKCCGAAFTRCGDGIKLELENGYKLTVTPDHEILTFYGMKKAEDLDTLNDLIACPILTPSIGDQKDIAPWLGSDINVAYLLGQLTGDGCCGVSCAISCGYNKNCIKIQKWIFQNLPLLNTTKYFHGRSWHLGVHCPELLNSPEHGNRKTKFHKFLEDIGLKKDCYSKTVPSIILRHSNIEVQRSYLAGWFDSDGSITCNDNRCYTCHITSESPYLIQGLRKLLQNLGLAHQVRRNRVHVWDSISLKTQIEKFLVIRNLTKRTSAGKHCSYVPWKEVKQQQVNSGLSVRKFAGIKKISETVFYPSRRKDKKNVLLNSAEKCGLNYGHLRFYKIKSKTIVRNQNFYGMSVAEFHNLIANGIVAKNCYQEQVMRVFVELANLPETDGYEFMKGCAKKKPELIDKYKDKFFKGALKQNISESTVEHIWDILYKFSGYSFNMAHAVSYAFLSFKTVYLKAHYPTEFFAARLSVASIRRNMDEAEKYEQDAEENFGFEILPPSINESKINWTVIGDKKLRKPILIKGVGVKAAEEIVKHQPYRGKDLLHSFASKVGKAVNSRVVAAMYDYGIWGKEYGNKERLVKDFEQIKKDKIKVRGRPSMDMFA